MIIDNLTNPGAQPSNGDLIRYTHPNGAVEEKVYFSITPEEVEEETVLTPYGFICLFTDAELLAIKAAAATDPVLDLFFERLKLAQEVLFSDQSTIDALNYLLAQGYITAERKAQIEAIDYTKGAE